MNACSAISNSYNNGTNRGLRGVLWDFIFYILLGVVITLSVQVGGIVVVFSYLIIPATISAVFSVRLRLQFAIVWSSAIIASLGGLLFAYRLDFSIGPAIALVLGCELVIISLIARFWP
ncbi:MAG: metal ABC transporter permease, partial [Planctomycetes bacterium]|nr:metal ABC transporter permease [Planctomycetota bacterium]